MIAGTEQHPSPDELVADPMDAGVQAHLRSCAACRIEQRRIRRWMDERPPPQDTPADLPSDLTARIDRDLAIVLRATHNGLLVRYALEDQRWIGNGDHGIAYEVFDRHQQRRVVLKVVRGVDETHLRRVAGAIERVAHPNLTRYHDILSGDPLHVTRPVVEGATFDEALERASRPKAIRLVGLVASALCALHREGLAHGSVSPSNIRVDPRGRLHVLDAGLAGADTTPRADWMALATLVRAHARPLLDDPGASAFSVSRMLSRMADGQDPFPDDVELLAALVLESGLGGLEATRYQIRNVLSAGGMGVLMRAWDPVLRREVALKQIKEGRSDSLDATRRFLNEARIAAQLQHPNIVPVHELDWGPDARPFLTMKLVDGRHFGELVHELHHGGPISLRDVVEIVARLCDAVAFAHGKGVLHLDLKPSNVLVGAYGDVQLIDWGAARVVGRAVDVDGDDRSEKQELTRPYSPPEQQDPARSAELEPRSDVFALGAILVHVLTGERPPELRPMPGVRALAPNAPRELASIVDRATRSDPVARYPDAASLGHDLRAWLRRDRVGAHAYDVLELADLYTRGRRGAIGLLLVSVITVATVGWIGVLGWRTSAINAERERERQGLVLAEQARLAWLGRDRVEAERKAAEAVALAGTPEGRGLLLRLSRRWYPRHAGLCTDEGGSLSCAVAGGTLTWTPTPASPPVTSASPFSCGPVQLWPPPGDRPSCDPYGRAFVVVRGDEADVWLTEPLREDVRLEGHAGSVVAVAWSLTGDWVATADEDGMVRLWEAGSGDELARLPDHHAVSALGFTASAPTAARGAYLVVAAEPPRVWDVRSARAPELIDALVSVVQVGWDPIGVTTLDRQGRWRSWKPADGWTDGDTEPNILAAAAAPDGSAIAFLTRTTLSVRERGGLPERWSRSLDTATTLTWTPDAIVTGGSDGVVRTFAPRTGEQGEPDDVGAPILQLASTRDGVLALDAGGAARIVGRADAPWANVGAIAVEPGGRRFALGSEDGTVRIGSGDVGAASPSLALGSAVLALAFAPDGHTLGVAADDHTVRLFGEEGADWRELSRSVLDGRSPAGLAFSPSGDTLAVAGLANKIELWDTAILREPAPVARVAELYGPAGGWTR
jgi:serine/threonine protein kinase/WD40 repeat protein